MFVLSVVSGQCRLDFACASISMKKVFRLLLFQVKPFKHNNVIMFFVVCCSVVCQVTLFGWTGRKYASLPKPHVANNFEITRYNFTLLDDFVPLLLIKLSRSRRSHRLQGERALFPKQVPVWATDPYSQPDYENQEPHYGDGSLFLNSECFSVEVKPWSQQQWKCLRSPCEALFVTLRVKGRQKRGWVWHVTLLVLWQVIKIAMKVQMSR